MSKFASQELTILDDSPLSSAYAETFIYAPAAKDEENLGYLYLAAEASSNKAKKENARLVAEIAQTLKNEYYKNTIVTPLSAFRFALKRVNQLIAGETNWLAPAVGLKLKLLAGSLKDKSLHLARLGDGAAFILRNNNLQNIIPASNAAAASLASSRAKRARTTNWSFENIISGELLNEDKVALATNEIHRLDSAELAYKLKNNNLVEYLKANSEGIRTLALITLEPLDPARGKRPAKPDEEDRPYRTNRTYKIKPILLVLVLLVVATAAVAAAVKTKSGSTQNKKEAEELVREINDINSKIPALAAVKNENEALELVQSAQEKLKHLAELKYFKTTQASLAQELDKLTSELKRVEEINNIRRVVDLENNSAGFEPRGLNLGRNKILIYGGASAYSFDLNRREGNFLSAEKDSDIVSILEKPEDPNSVLAATKDKIINITPNSPAPANIWSRSESEPVLKQATVYGQSFYFLGENGLIYKLPFEISSTTAEILPDELAVWINQNQIADNSPRSSSGEADKLLITGFEVEGSVYALAEGNAVVKFLNGELKNKKNLLEKVTDIFTGLTHKNIYLLSPEEGLVIVLDKDLNLKTRYSHPELRGAVSLAVNSQERLVYFLKGKTVYSFEI